MDINKFLEQTGGQWFSQRTTYNLTQTETEVENSKANLTVEILAPDHPQITNLCQVNSLNSSLILGAIATSWDNSPDWGKPKQQGSSLLALIKNEDNEQTGQIYRVIKKPEPKIIVGTYVLGNDQALTFTLKQDNNSVEERIWFGSPNLRMRTIINKNQDQCTMTSFYSEIRKVTQK
jgi:hypothetical protein